MAKYKITTDAGEYEVTVEDPTPEQPKAPGVRALESRPEPSIIERAAVNAIPSTVNWLNSQRPGANGADNPSSGKERALTSPVTGKSVSVHDASPTSSLGGELLETIQGIGHLVLHPLESFADDPAGTAAAVATAGRGMRGKIQNMRAQGQPPQTAAPVAPSAAAEPSLGNELLKQTGRVLARRIPGVGTAMDIADAVGAVKDAMAPKPGPVRPPLAPPPLPPEPVSVPVAAQPAAAPPAVESPIGPDSAKTIEGLIAMLERRKSLTPGQSTLLEKLKAQMPQPPAAAFAQELTGSPEGGTIPFSKENPPAETFKEKARAERGPKVEAIAKHLNDAGITADQVESIPKAKWRDIGDALGLELPKTLTATVRDIQKTLFELQRTKKAPTVFEPSQQMKQSLSRPGAMDAARKLYEAIGQ